MSCTGSSRASRDSVDGDRALGSEWAVLVAPMMATGRRHAFHREDERSPADPRRCRERLVRAAARSGSVSTPSGVGKAEELDEVGHRPCTVCHSHHREMVLVPLEIGQKGKACLVVELRRTICE